MRRLVTALLALVASSCGEPDALQIDDPGGGAGSGPVEPAACDVDAASEACTECHTQAESACGRGSCGGISNSLHACAEVNGCLLDATTYDQGCLQANCPTELGTMFRCVLSCDSWGACGGYPDGICDTDPAGIGCATCQVRDAERCDGIVCSSEHAAWNGCAIQCADDAGVVDQVCEADLCPAERDAMYGCEERCIADSTCGGPAPG